MSHEQNVHIIGVGDDGAEGLTSRARQLIENADLLIGSEHSLKTAGRTNCERLEVGSDLRVLVEHIEKDPGRKIVVLASGDPLFYGVARYLCDKLGKDRFEVVPHVSSMQLAFARVKESWDEAYLTNLATQDLATALERIRTAEKVGLFTTPEAAPADVARALLDAGIDYFHAYVCENLGSPDERVTDGELADVGQQTFAPLNVMILVRKANVPDRSVETPSRRLFGNPDLAFAQSRPKRGLITPMEVRCIALAELDLEPTSTVWDIGAGSGAVAIEAACVAAKGTTYAIEMDPQDHQLITANIQTFGVENVVPVLGKAPDAWAELPAPDAIFVGGTGRTVSRIVEQALIRLRPGGRLVANVASIENLSDVQKVLREHTGEARVRMISLAHGNYQLERIRLEAMNPSFLISATRPATT